MILNLITLVLILLSCISNDSEACIKRIIAQKETYNVFTLDSINNIVNLSYKEIGDLSSETDQSKYCEWLMGYKELVSRKINKASSTDKENYLIVVYAELSAQQYFVDYDGSCELVDIEEIPLQVTNSINRIFQCVKPPENRFKPKLYSKCYSKTFPKTNGVRSLIQVWYN